MVELNLFTFLQEKKVYVDRAAERKAEYERNLKEQNDEAEDNVIV